MELFLPTIEQMGFLLLFIAVGFVLVKIKFLSSNSMGVLSKLENSVFIPALILSTFIKNFTVENIKKDWLVIVFSLGMLAVVIPLSFLVAKLCAKKDDFLKKTYAYGLTFANFGFMGNAVVQAIFPEIFFEYLIFTIPLWTAIYGWGAPALLMDGGGKKGIKATLKRFCNPMLISTLIGIILGLTACPVPDFLTRALDSAGACMLTIF